MLLSIVLLNVVTFDDNITGTMLTGVVVVVVEAAVDVMFWVFEL